MTKITAYFLRIVFITNYNRFPKHNKISFWNKTHSFWISRARTISLSLSSAFAFLTHDLRFALSTNCRQHLLRLWKMLTLLSTAHVVLDLAKSLFSIPNFLHNIRPSVWDTSPPRIQMENWYFHPQLMMVATLSYINLWHPHKLVCVARPLAIVYIDHRLVVRKRVLPEIYNGH